MQLPLKITQRNSIVSDSSLNKMRLRHSAELLQDVRINKNIAKTGMIPGIRIILKEKSQ